MKRTGRKAHHRLRRKPWPAACAALMLLWTLLAAACDDNATASSQRLDLVEFATDGSGVARRMVLDTGDTLLISNPFGGLQADTLLRYLATFITYNDTPQPTAHVTGRGAVLCSPPAFYRRVFADSVRMQSVWRGGRYLNVALQTLTHGRAHAFGFAIDGIKAWSDSTLTLRLILYHDRGSDPQDYPRTVYLCCPLDGLRQHLRPGRDSIRLQYNQYGKGLAYKTVVY